MWATKCLNLKHCWASSKGATNLGNFLKSNFSLQELIGRVWQHRFPADTFPPRNCIKPDNQIRACHFDKPLAIFVWNLSDAEINNKQALDLQKYEWYCSYSRCEYRRIWISNNAQVKSCSTFSTPSSSNTLLQGEVKEGQRSAVLGLWHTTGPYTPKNFKERPTGGSGTS